MCYRAREVSDSGVIFGGCIIAFEHDHSPGLRSHIGAFSAGLENSGGAGVHAETARTVRRIIRLTGFLPM
jgi:hypothetical protein